MKKVGMLTFHYAINHGAVLQAYALYKAINHFLNCNAEIINYVPKGYSHSVFSNSSILNDQKIKRQKFSEFLMEHCGVHSPMLHTVVGNAYDVYLVGSDQIWNTDIPEAAAYEYFLPNLNDDAKRIAYSASIGMDIDNINQKLFRKYLKKFKAISIREKSYVEIISELSGRTCQNTLDPAMLLSQKDYEPLIEKPVTEEDEFLLYFWYNDSSGGLNSFETVNALARKYNLAVKHTFSRDSLVTRHMIANDGGYMFDAGIGEFLWYIKNAKVIVTNSFHGAVFALLFKKPLYIFYPEIRRCRQENLVDMFNLQNRVIQGYICPDQLNLEMDYTSIFSILEKEREKSIAYLKHTIETV